MAAHNGGKRIGGYVDIIGLQKELAAEVRGEVRFDMTARALYSADASNYRHIPTGLVVPLDREDVLASVAVCRNYGAPILPRGGGVSLAGQSCNAAVVIDFSKYMNRIIELDPDKRMARVQPGVILDDLRDAAEKYHLTFGPDPATHNHCTLGGMIGNNSCGVHSVMAGKTEDNIEELEVLTYDGSILRAGRTEERELDSIITRGGRRGEIYTRLKSLRDRYAPLLRTRYPQIPRRVSGYNLYQLLPENGFHVARALVGTEGTCAMVLESTVRLVQSPPYRSLLVVGYPDVYGAADHVMEIMKFKPIGLEGFDRKLAADVQKKGFHAEGLGLLPEGGGWLLVEFGGEERKEAYDRARRVMKELGGRKNSPSMRLYDDPDREKKVWKVRESGLGAAARVPGKKDTWPGWEDAGIHPEKLGGYLRDFRSLVQRYGYDCSLYGHFGQGCVHTRIDFDLQTQEGIQNFRSFIEDASDLVVRYGGSFSGEHGDGQSRAELLPKMFGADLVRVFGEFKAVWDPQGKMNPGKVVDPYRIDEDLRLDGYRPENPQTHFSFSEDQGSFPRAAMRCVGVGECRREHGGVMCPSFRGTREELHSTRGRARMLFEMFRGDFLMEGWREDHVRESLDLCLSCKGCKSDCPVNVDVATYKAEFLSHYYKRRLRPLDAYSMGLIYWWSRLASHMPGLANFSLQKPPLGTLLKKMGGISKKREFPLFAAETFKEWFRKRGARNGGRPQVILWADTFNNFFHPEIAQAAVEVLEGNGFQVRVPLESLCCGRPLFDYGMISLAKHLLRQVLNALERDISEGIPVVGLEPACVTTFRDELVQLFPGEERAKRLSDQFFLLSEFLEKKVPDFTPPKLLRKAIVQPHCHHHSVLKTGDEERVLSKMGLDYKMLDAGCCGVSGAFGFRKNNYDLSRKIGEQALLPSIRKAPRDALIIANGFSCQLQIAQATDRRALHLAQVLCLAMRERTLMPDLPPEPLPFPEEDAGHNERRENLVNWAMENRRSLGLAGAIAAGTALVFYAKKRLGKKTTNEA